MASAKASHIEDALASLDSVQEYRQAMTNQVAGFVWSIWALALLGIGLGSLVGVLASIHLGITAQWLDLAFILLLTGTGALLTGGAYRMLAIHEDHSAWKPWLFGAGAVVLLGGIVTLSNALASDSAGSNALLMAPFALAGALVAGTLTLYMRSSISTLPGWIATGLLVAAFLNARFATYGNSAALDVFGNLGLIVFVFATFLVVGVVLFRRG